MWQNCIGVATYWRICFPFNPLPPNHLVPLLLDERFSIGLNNMPRACLVQLSKDYLLFKSQPASLSSQPSLHLQRPCLTLNQYQSSNEGNGQSEAGSLNLIDIYLSSANLNQPPHHLPNAGENKQIKLSVQKTSHLCHYLQEPSCRWTHVCGHHRHRQIRYSPIVWLLDLAVMKKLSIPNLLLFLH